MILVIFQWLEVHAGRSYRSSIARFGIAAAAPWYRIAAGARIVLRSFRRKNESVRYNTMAGRVGLIRMVSRITQRLLRRSTGTHAKGVMMKRNCLFLACLLPSVYFSAAYGGEESLPNARVPLSVFARLPLVQGAHLSPNGEHLALLRNHEGRTLLMTQKLYSQEDPRLVTNTDNIKSKIRWFAWANDERLLVGILFASHRGGTPIMETRLLAINRDGSKPINVVKIEYNQSGAEEWEAQFRDKVIDYLPDDKDHILVGADLETPGAPTVYRINIYTGKRKRIQRSNSPILEWITDSQGNVRVGSGYKAADYRIIVRDLHKKKWRHAWQFNLLRSDPIQPMGFGADPNILYVRYGHEGRAAVFSVDISKKALEKKLVFADPEYDIGGALIISRRTREAVGVYYVSDTGRNHYWDESAKAFQASVDEALPDTINYIVSTSRDESRYVVFATNTTVPGTYYIGERESGRMAKILDNYPELNRKNLSGKKQVTYTARDGLEIQGYLTLPKGEKNRPLPAVIYPHGGPSARDVLAFDYWTEFFASRGYAVLQMNFRGSGGYGSSHSGAGRRRWGLEMQDDITDGAMWLVDQGIADPQRMCIVGASYGGYAALMGAVKTPDLFQCAVSFAGVSDLKLLLRRSFWFRNRELVGAQIGDTWRDKDRLNATSPLEQVDRIRIPVLIAHGNKDRVVDIKHSNKMAKALMSNGKVFEYLELEDGDHRLSLQRNRTILFERMASFLETHLRKKEGETPNTGALAAIEHYSEDTDGNGTMEPDTNLIGSDISNHVPSSADPRLCRSACAADSRCVAWTYVRPYTAQGSEPRCWLKYDVPRRIKSGCCASGIMARGQALDLESKPLGTSFTYSEEPAFTIAFPEGASRIPFDAPDQVFAARMVGGLIFQAAVADAPPGWTLDKAAEFYVKSLKEGGVGSGFKISSNAEITLKDGTRAYRSEIRWFYIPMRVRLQTQLVSASKDGKIVSVTAHPLENAEPIPPIVESLRFDEEQSDAPESGAVL